MSFIIASCHTPLWNIWMFIIPWQYACISIFFLPSMIVSGKANFVYDTKYCIFGIMCHVALLSQYQLPAFTLFALEAPITCTTNASAFFFAADLPPIPCMLLLLRALCSPVTELFALIARKFLFCVISSSFHWFTGIHFYRIWLLLVIFMCNEHRSFNQCQFVSLQLNCTELLNEQIHCLFARRNGIPNILKLM